MIVSRNPGIQKANDPVVDDRLDNSDLINLLYKHDERCERDRGAVQGSASRERE